MNNNKNSRNWLLTSCCWPCKRHPSILCSVSSVLLDSVWSCPIDKDWTVGEHWMFTSANSEQSEDWGDFFSTVWLDVLDYIHWLSASVGLTHWNRIGYWIDTHHYQQQTTTKTVCKKWLLSSCFIFLLTFCDHVWACVFILHNSGTACVTKVRVWTHCRWRFHVTALKRKPEPNRFPKKQKLQQEDQCICQTKHCTRQTTVT